MMVLLIRENSRRVTAPAVNDGMEAGLALVCLGSSHVGTAQ